MYAYHTYPGYGQNMNPETMDYGAYQTESPRALRDLVTHYPGVKPGIPFFDDEFNSIPRGSVPMNRCRQSMYRAVSSITWQQE